jgi:Putative lumazine-binding
MIARMDDHDEIVRVVQLYVDGFNRKEAAKFKEAFEENASIFYIDADGKPHKNLISEDFEKWAHLRQRCGSVERERISGWRHDPIVRLG